MIGDVERRIGHHDLGQLLPEDLPVAVGLERMAAQEPVRAERPEVSGTRDRASFGQLRDLILRSGFSALGLPALLEDEVDLAHLEAGQLDIEVEIAEALQLDRQDLTAPARFLGQPIVDGGRSSTTWGTGK